MAQDINQVILVGRLTRDPELSYTSNEMAICKFSIANNRFKRKDQQDDEVNYFDIVTWDKLATLCDKFLAKGRQVIVEGRLKQDRFVDKNTGQNRSKIEITATNIQFLGSKQEQGAPMNDTSSPSTTQSEYASSSRERSIEFDTPTPMSDSLEDDGVPF